MWTRASIFRFIRKGSVQLWHRQRVACWACKQPALDLVCQSCGKVQPAVIDSNYFKVLDQKEQFSINPTELQKKFRELQRVLHPDKFANCSDEEKTYSADQSALVNQAYQVLSKPIQRATYLLKLNGVTLDEVKLPQNFLLEMMDLNEQIDEANDEEKRSLQQSITDAQEAAMSELQESFAAKDNAKASDILAKIKYLDNLMNRLK